MNNNDSSEDNHTSLGRRSTLAVIAGSISVAGAPLIRAFSTSSDASNDIDRYDGEAIFSIESSEDVDYSPIIKNQPGSVDISKDNETVDGFLRVGPDVDDVSIGLEDTTIDGAVGADVQNEVSAEIEDASIEGDLHITSNSDTDISVEGSRTGGDLRVLSDGNISASADISFDADSGYDKLADDIIFESNNDVSTSIDVDADNDNGSNLSLTDSITVEANGDISIDMEVDQDNDDSDVQITDQITFEADGDISADLEGAETDDTLTISSHRDANVDLSNGSFADVHFLTFRDADFSAEGISSEETAITARRDLFVDLSGGTIDELSLTATRDVSADISGVSVVDGPIRISAGRDKDLSIGDNIDYSIVD